MSGSGPRDLWVGVMSGTSLDGLDVVLAELDGERPRLIAAHTGGIESGLRGDLLRLCNGHGDDLDLLGRCDAALGAAIGDAVLSLLDDAGVPREHVRAIGSHGQTVRHRPNATPPFSLQIGCPAVIAERTGIRTVADFRRRDLAAGGQGAPLVPAFHAALFSDPEQDRVVVNIGGMANITTLPARTSGRGVGGFDTGPGNVLLDAWAQDHLLEPMDKNGAWAGQAPVDDPLLERLLDDDYFRAPAPKSTGREHFDVPWLEARLGEAPPAPAAVAATLTELTARTIALGIRETAGLVPDEVLVCGGGRRNDLLMTRIGAALPGSRICGTDEYGVDGDWIEGLAFAWFARERLAGRAANVPEVTGARGPRILGAVHEP